MGERVFASENSKEVGRDKEMMWRLKFLLLAVLTVFRATMKIVVSALERLFVRCSMALRLDPLLTAFYKFKIRINPANKGQALSQIGFLHEQRGDLEQAAACYEEAARSEPKHALHYWDLGCIYEKQNRKALAVNMFEEALRAGTEFGQDFRNELLNRIATLRDATQSSGV